MKFAHEYLCWLFMAAILLVICVVADLVGCAGHGHMPRCTMGVSDDAQAVCCEVYCRDKGMQMDGKRQGKVNPEELQCICVQPENKDNGHADKGPTGLF